VGVKTDAECGGAVREALHYSASTDVAVVYMSFTHAPLGSEFVSSQQVSVPCPELELLSFIKTTTGACHKRDQVPETVVSRAESNAL